MTLTPTETALIIIGAMLIGCGVALGCLVAMARREMKRRAMIARANRLPKVEHCKP